MPRPPEVLTLDRMTTPLGEGLLVTDAGGYLRAFDWTTHETRLTTLLRRQNPPADLVGGAAPAAVRAELDQLSPREREVMRSLSRPTLALRSTLGRY